MFNLALHFYLSQRSPFVIHLANCFTTESITDYFFFFFFSPHPLYFFFFPFSGVHSLREVKYCSKRCYFLSIGSIGLKLIHSKLLSYLLILLMLYCNVGYILTNFYLEIIVERCCLFPLPLSV